MRAALNTVAVCLLVVSTAWFAEAIQAQQQPFDLSISIGLNEHQSFEVTVVNRGSVDAWATARLDTSDLIFDSVSFPRDTLAVFDPATGVWDIGALPAGAETTITFSTAYEEDGLKVRRLTATVTSLAPKEQDEYLANNTSTIWVGHPRLGIHARYRVMRTAAKVEVQVENRNPSPGEAATFTIEVEEPRFTETAEITFWAEVDIQLHGLTLAANPAAPANSAFTTIDGIPPSRGGRWRLTDLCREVGDSYSCTPDQQLSLVATPVGDRPLEQSCLTARITKSEPDIETHRYRFISEATVCLGEDPPVLVDSTHLDLFTLFPCIGVATWPCNSDDTLELVSLIEATSFDNPIRRTDIRGHLGSLGQTILLPERVIVQVPDPFARKATSGSVWWETRGGPLSPSQGASIRENVDRLIAAGTWSDYVDRIRATSVDGGRRPGYVRLFGVTGGGSSTFLHASTEPPTASEIANDYYEVDDDGYYLYPLILGHVDGAVTRGMVLRFGALGTYKTERSYRITHGGTQYTATGTYTFHVGPIAELEVRDGGPALLELEPGQTAYTAVAVNHGPDDPLGAVVEITLPDDASVVRAIPSAGTYRSGVWDVTGLQHKDYYRITGKRLEGEELILILDCPAGGCGEATARIYNDNARRPYTICVSFSSLTLPHATRATCEADTANFASWHEGTVYDHIDANNTARLRARAGSGGGSAGRPVLLDAQQASVILEWAQVEAVNGWPVSHYQVRRWAGDWRAPLDVDGTLYVDSQVVDGETYRYQVRAVNLPGVPGPWSLALERKAAGVPSFGEPQRPVLSAAPLDGKGRERILVTWDRPADNGSAISRYQLQWSDRSSGPWTDVDRQPVAGLESYAYIYPPLDRGRLTGGTRKYFRLRATNAQGDSPWSAVVSATTNQPGQAGPPTDVVARGASGADAGSVIVVTWRPPADDGGTPLTGYDVQWSANGTSGWRTAGRVGADTPWFNDAGLGWGTTRFYRVAARTRVGLSPWSNTAPGATAVQDQRAGVSVPGAPTNLQLFPDSHRVHVTWDAPANDGGSPIRGYRVHYRFRDPDRGRTGAWDAWGELSYFPADTFVTMTATYNDVEFQVRVAAVNGVGTSLYTPAETGIYESGFNLPEEPRNVEFQPGDGRIVVTWREPWWLGDPPLSSYRVQWRVNASVDEVPWTAPTSADSIRVGRSARSYTITGLTNGTTYQVRVWAVNSVGDSPKAGEDGKLKATPQQ